MPFTRHPVGRVGAAQGDVLVHGDIVANLGRFTNHAETMVEEEIAANLGAGVNVYAR